MLNFVFIQYKYKPQLCIYTKYKYIYNQKLCIYTNTIQYKYNTIQLQIQYKYNTNKIQYNKNTIQVVQLQS